LPIGGTIARLLDTGLYICNAETMPRPANERMIVQSDSTAPKTRHAAALKLRGGEQSIGNHKDSASELQNLHRRDK
jgi:hypothetical protein